MYPDKNTDYGLMDSDSKLGFRTLLLGFRTLLPTLIPVLNPDTDSGP